MESSRKRDNPSDLHWSSSCRVLFERTVGTNETRVGEDGHCSSSSRSTSLEIVSTMKMSSMSTRSCSFVRDRDVASDFVGVLRVSMMSAIHSKFCLSLAFDFV